jgi:ethanolamine permease
LQDEKYQKAVYAVAIFYALGILYFAFYGRNQLILSPEEEFAMSKGEKGHA